MLPYKVEARKVCHRRYLMPTPRPAYRRDILFGAIAPGLHTNIDSQSDPTFSHFLNTAPNRTQFMAEHSMAQENPNQNPRSCHW